MKVNTSQISQKIQHTNRGLSQLGKIETLQLWGELSIRILVVVIMALVLVLPAAAEAERQEFTSMI